MSADAELAVVTGGSQGIGRAVALRLAERRRRDVLIVDLEEPDPGLRKEFAAFGVQLHFARADVGSQAEVAEVVATVRRLGRPRELVNSAAIFPRAAAIDMEYADWLHVVVTNLGGTFLMCRGLAPLMQQNGGGAIVNMASGRAVAGAVNGSHYSASKGGVIALTRSLALEWAPTIRVNAVMPGLTDSAQPRASGMTEEEIYAMGDGIPMRRIGQPADVAAVVDFVSSDDAGYMTGQTVAVNGGSVML